MPDCSLLPHEVAPGRLITAESFFIDRIRSDCEVIALPPKSVAGGHLSWECGPVTAPALPRHWLRGLMRSGSRAGGGITAPDDRWLVDLRLHSPANWAHFLNNHLPLLFALADQAGLPLAEALVLLPGDTPGHITQAAALFGLETLCTDDQVTGWGLRFDLAPWVAQRAVRHKWVRLPRFRAVLDRIAATPADGALPKRVFLSRKDSRILSNSPEIETILARRGYETLYPETLTPGDQIRLFLQAEDMVAIHGAGLAPLLYCTPDRGLKRLVEILPCGHMTDVYRVMAGQVGCAWIGVRGRLKPEYVAPAYALDRPFREYSLDAFEADPASIEQAFGLLDIEEMAG